MTAPAFAQFLLQHGDVVAATFVVQLQCRVAGNPAGRGLEHALAGKQRRESATDDVLQPRVHAAVTACDTHQARQPCRHLHHGEPGLGFSGCGLEPHGQVQTQVRQHGKGPRRIDGERGQRRQHLVVEIGVQRGPRVHIQVFEAQDAHAVLREGRQDRRRERAGHLVDQLVRAD